jgi:ubiquinol-cytochrome c reductase cytochrome b subunit
MKALLDWFDARTGVRKLTREALFETVPGGARWRYVWGSTLTFCISVQFVTGIFLWMAYTPSAQAAWESVFYIQNEMYGGWLLRGIHHYTAQAMVVLLALHLMQVVIDGAYRAPREVNFWTGVVLLLLTMGLGLTGYLLPWDQKGYWATRVATNLAAITPIIGPELQRVLVGGPEYGHHTLTRFFALHAGVLPGLMVAVIVGHIYLFRRHGLTVKEPKRRPDTTFWPDQVLKDAVACLAVLATVLFLVLKPAIFGSGPPGADLGAPANPAESYSAARPEWYYLFLFQLLKYFPGATEIIGAIVIPTLVLMLVCAMPMIGKWRLGHRFNLGVLFALLSGVVLLTWRAIHEDRNKHDFLLAVQHAKQEAERVRVLAMSPTGIPPTGALDLLRDDPLTQGPKLFARHCASCHRYDGHNGLGETPADPQSAAELKGFASRAWLAGLLDPAKVDSTNYFGATKFRDGKMSKFVKGKVASYNAEKQEQLRKVVAAVSAEAGLKSQAATDASETALIAAGRQFLVDEMACTDCHQFRVADDTATAPDLTGYGSRAWLVEFLRNPKHKRFYGERNDRMPAFGENGTLDEKSIGLLADWLRGDWYEPQPTQ